MSKSEEWRTYTGEQARQVWSAFQILMEKGLLSEDEKEDAKRIQSKLRNAMQKEGPEYTAVPFSGTQEDLLIRVEQSLWR